MSHPEHFKAYLVSDIDISGTLFVRIKQHWSLTKQIAYLFKEARHYAIKTGAKWVKYQQLPVDIKAEISRQGGGSDTTFGFEIDLGDLDA